MDTAEQILVIILSSALAVFLVIAIVIGVLAIKLLKNLQAIAAKAESLVDSAEAVGDMVRNTVGRLSVLKFVKTVVDLVHGKAKK